MPRSPGRRIRLATLAGGLKAVREPGRARLTSAGLTPVTGARTTRFCRTRPAHRQGVSSGLCTSAQVPAKAEAAPFVCAPGKRSRGALDGKPPHVPSYPEAVPPNCRAGKVLQAQAGSAKNRGVLFGQRVRPEVRIGTRLPFSASVSSAASRIWVSRNDGAAQGSTGDLLRPILG